jgi:hypothetical protein
MSTDKSAAAARELVERWMGKKHPITMRSYVSDLTALISEHYVSKEEYDEEKKSNALLHKAMVTAEKGGHDKAMEEISEHYYPKEKYDELLQQRDELKEALINVMVVVRDCYPLLFDNEKPAVKQAEAAIKNTER